MNAWIECPECKGVLKISESVLEGPCIFCRVPLRVIMSVVAIDEHEAKGKELARKAPRHQGGRGPMPKLRPVVRQQE